MAAEISTIQSLKAVDAWIDVINANINGGVRTAFKSSRLKFAGSNVDVSRAGNATSLPLQFPEPGLTTANTVIDFSQGAITASTETTHLAIQGQGFFLLQANFDASAWPATGTYGPNYLTRDGEFRTDQNGFLRSASGMYLSMNNGPGFGKGYVIYNDIDLGLANMPPNYAFPLSQFLTVPSPPSPIFLPNDLQGLRYSKFGSTVFDFPAAYTVLTATLTTILSKSLEASNASMTQSVPELSLAQKLFSALTKVLQTKQTNVDGVLNLVR